MSAISDLILSLDEASDTRGGITLTAEQLALITGNTTLIDDLKKIADGHLPPTLTIKDVCADLRIHRKTLWDWRRAGRFTVRPLSGGGQPRYDRTEYVNWKLGRHAA